MLRNDGKNDKLLLLWQAAVKLEGSDIDRMIIDARQKRFQTVSGLKNCIKVFEKYVPVKNSHNEIERTRRAHLRGCMDDLKNKLVFASEYSFSRITMLNVLRKAALTIKNRERSIRTLYHEESNLKGRNTQLKQRLLNLDRQMSVLHKQQQQQHLASRSPSCVVPISSSAVLDKRNRNCSECSIITTSSEESHSSEEARLLMDQQRLHYRQLKLRAPSRLSSFIGERVVCENGDDAIAAPGTNTQLSGVLKCHSPLSSSSDSGFDDFSNAAIISKTTTTATSKSGAVPPPWPSLANSGACVIPLALLRR